MFKGVITTLLAIPCGAPLLSLSLLWVENQVRAGATGSIFIVYFFIALGMASPFLLIGAFPELMKFMPKPGVWMDSFKKTMGFVLLLAVIWIFSFLTLELLLPTLAVLFALWFACWFIGSLEFNASASKRLFSWTVSLVVVLVTIFFSYNISVLKNPYTLQNLMVSRLEANTQRELVKLMTVNENTDQVATERSEDSEGESKHWELFTVAKLDEAIAEGRPVMIDFTADWCMSCKFFEMTVLDTQKILEHIDRKGVVSLRADCTKPEMEGAQFLKKLGSESVPVLALFDPANPSEPTVVRGGFTRTMVVELLDKLEDVQP